MRALRQNETITFEDQITVMECPVKGCGVTYGLGQTFQRNRRKDHQTWYCPNGHDLHYPPGKSDADKLRDAEARETALRDQLQAAAEDKERVVQALVRDRIRFSNGVCPCCNRSFENVRRHMESKHPDYDATKVVATRDDGLARCTCGRTFETLRGLRTHQGHQRSDDWWKPDQYTWRAHRTVEPVR